MPEIPSLQLHRTPDVPLPSIPKADEPAAVMALRLLQQLAVTQD